MVPKRSPDQDNRKISIVIPVYNEAAHIDACLRSIAQQHRAPFEVIVVDNGSTDESLSIVRNYPFVKVIHEQNRGLVYARQAGFDEARGEYIVRIDADVRLPPDYIIQLQRSISAHHTASGIAGVAVTDSLPFTHFLQSTFWTVIYLYQTAAFFRHPVMWGANMVLRRDAWQLIRTAVCLDETLVHEDQDLSMELQKAGGTVVIDRHLCVSAQTQALHRWPKLIEYTKRRRSTRARHRGTMPPVRPLKLLQYGLIQIAAAPFGVLFMMTSFLLRPFDAYRAHER